MPRGQHQRSGQCEESCHGAAVAEHILERRRRVRIEGANIVHATFDHIEIFYNRQRRHSQLEYLSPVEHEIRFTPRPISA
jgi:transposase InsO family protein